ncbi:MAG: DUF1501 domain-containing protein [Pseudomonadota bacterium]
MTTRRRLLTGTATLAGVSMVAPLMLSPVNAHATFGDYKALVCVFLFGGNDGWNMLVPRSEAEHTVYANSRQNMAIDRDDLIPITPNTTDGSEYGLHPSLIGIQGLFDAGAAAFTANVGPLIEPTTLEQYQNKSVQRPPQLFSHNDQQSQWHTLKGAAPSATGWAGRLADLLAAQTTTQMIPSTSSLFGSTTFLVGASTQPYVMGPGGPLAFSGFADTGIGLEQRLAFERIVAARQANIYGRGYAAIQQRALDNADLINTTLANAPVLSTTFANDVLSQQLQTVARLIAVRDDLQMERQVFFVALGGFDTHDDQVMLQPGLLANIDAAMTSFYDATVELNVADRVTTFTQSDFGRTLTSNGDGTDHAWGSVALTVGGGVAGRDIYGAYPLLDIGGNYDVGGGRLIPTTSADQYAATLAQWMDPTLADLETVAPNIGNFAQQNLGFMI